MAIDLNDLLLVDRETVKLLALRESKRAEIRNCSGRQGRQYPSFAERREGLRLVGIHMKRHRDRTIEYATREEFCQVFQKDVDSLYQLAFLLTTDQEKAQEIFVAGIDECASGNPVFKEWARSWARRVIIRSAIRVIKPVPGESEGRFIEDNEHKTGLSPGQAIVHLSPFKRFVFIMSVLENISDRECAARLACGTADIERTRVRALRAVAQSELRKHKPEKQIVPLERRLEVV